MLDKGLLPSSKMYFHTNSDFSKKSLFYLIYSGEFYSTPDYCIERENFNNYLLLRVRKGKMKIIYDNREFFAMADSILFLDCHRKHLYQSEEDTVFDWFHFSGSTSKDFFDLLYNKHGCVYPKQTNPSINDLMDRILLMGKDNQLDELQISILIQKIFYELDQTSIQSDTLHEKTIASAIQYLENNYKEPISLTELSNHVNLSPYYFLKVFKNHMNCTPHQYLINTRINHAKHLLHHTNLSVNEIAFSCGFNSTSHFVTTFKKHSDHSPAKFRQIQF